MKTFQSFLLPLCFCLLAGLFACGSEEGDDNPGLTDDDPTNETAVDVSILAEKFYNSDALTVVVSDDIITITSSGEPDHKSMYYETGDPLYEPYNEPNNPDFRKNPNRILSQNIVMKIPRYPAKAATPQATSMGPIGLSVNSVALFNQMAAPGDDILDELNTFDQYEGHPQQQGMYHYHTEPVYITGSQGDDAFVGFLLDGFPVYGPVEDGVRLTNDELDDYHGHTGPTADFPDGIYHYHVTDELPWINGDGYYGTSGTITF